MPVEQFDPETAGMVLKVKAFHPLINKKTGNKFSYTYAMAERNNSANNDQDIFFRTDVKGDDAEKVQIVQGLHYELVKMHDDMKQADRDKDRSLMRRIKKAITEKFEEIDLVCYPLSERKTVESKEAKRFRLSQQNELTLDAASIAALTASAGGSTADSSLDKAKLEVAQDEIRDLKAAAASKTAVPKPARTRAGLGGRSPVKKKAGAK